MRYEGNARINDGVIKMDKTIDRVVAYRNCGLGIYGIEYLGQQRRKGGHSLDLFRDLKTKVNFVRLPGETILEARDRARLEFLHTGEVCGMVGIVVEG